MARTACIALALATIIAVLVVAEAQWQRRPHRPQMQIPSNIDPLLNNDAYVTKQINCVKNIGPCDQLGRTIKKAIPLILDNCSKCSPQDKENAQKLYNFLQTRRPADLQEIRMIYQRSG